MKTDDKKLVFNEHTTIMNATLTHIKSNNLMQLSTLKKALTLVVFFVFTTISFYGQSGTCSVDIRAMKNRNSKNVSNQGSAYRMVITNNGNSADTFMLSSKDINSTCSNPDGSSAASNSVLIYEFLDSDNNKITEISLNAGETYNFLVSVIVPKGTALNSWSCIEIVASSINCENYSSNTILQSMVIDPDEG